MTAIIADKPAKPKRTRKLKATLPSAAHQVSFVDKQARKKLAEGRSHGMGVAFCKRAGNAWETVTPISSCKDYLNDQVYTEHTGKPYRAHGLQTKKEGIFDTNAYIATSICKMGARNPTEYHGYKDEVKLFNESYQKIGKLLNAFEEQAKVDGRTEVLHYADNLVLFTVPLYWVSTTYMISLYTLLMRNGLTYEGQPIAEFLKLIVGPDAYMINSISPKVDKLLGGFKPTQDFTQSISWHNAGIVGCNF